MEDEDKEILELELLLVNNKLKGIKELKNRRGIKENITSKSIELLEEQKLALEKKLNQQRAYQ